MSPSCCGPAREPTERPAPGAGAAAPGPDADAPALVEVPAGTFTMGTDDPRGYAEDGEGPAHEVELAAYAIGVHTVTNDQFARFVEKTGHVTTAERFGDSFVFAGLLPDDFPPTRAVAAAPWWRQVAGASWRAPEGPGSTLDDRLDHPVVHVSWDDARAFCAWSGTRLPTEAEWERAARGGVEDLHFPWGAEREPCGEHRMNVWQGSFPQHDTAEDGWAGTCPVGTFPPNDLGLHEVTGNVWEWCADWFDPGYYARSPRVAPTGPGEGTSRVMRGGSYLCHDSYCWRYRVDARSSNTPDSTTGNLGFRVAR
ncbi:formylglycine-generating enzyme family protein [Nocardioides aestuarii]|uniref:Formylglycine-generating enzyme family protein n=1 Tax=Nocardioides aestuarii TaxID=252231 RepID=A0ABW4TN45_9ACTN